MVLCIIALPVFLILAIFSAKYRQLAWESMQCTFLKMTFRPCHVGLDKRLKAQFIGHIQWLPQSWQKAVYKHFDVLSILFTALFVISLIYVVIGGYNYYLYGNCNGPNSDGFCVFDPTGQNTAHSTLNAECRTTGDSPNQITLEFFDPTIFPSLTREGAKNNVIFMGCSGCTYTRQVKSIMDKLKNNPRVNFTFAHLPVKVPDQNITVLEYCTYKQNQTEFWKLYDFLFTYNYSQYNKTEIISFIETLSIDTEQFQTCIATRQLTVDQQQSQILTTNIYGTPTIVINGAILVGPKPQRVYERLLK